MWRYLIVAALLAGCAQLPPSPQDIEARKFESILDKAAIYIVCESTSAQLSAPLWLGQGAQITLWQGNYHRWVVEPGSHTIAGIGASTASITTQAQAGQIYFVYFRAVRSTILHRLERALSDGATGKDKHTDHWTCRVAVVGGSPRKTQEIVNSKDSQGSWLRLAQLADSMPPRKTSS
jgi:hypothetical protein